MKKNSGRKQRRQLMFAKEDKITIAYQVIALKKEALKSKYPEAKELARITQIETDSNKYTRDAICQLRAKFKRVLNVD